MKFLFFANTDWYLYNFRLTLLKEVQRRGHEVVLASPPGDFVSRLEDEGFQWVECPMDPASVHPVRELGSLARVIRAYNQVNPDVVHHFTLKSVIYGSLAAQVTGVRHVINAVTGLGHFFTSPGVYESVIRLVLKVLMAVAFRGSHVIFQNMDDLTSIDESWVSSHEKAHLIPSSGVDLAKFKANGKPSGPVTVVLASRMLWKKGIDDFVAAGRTLRNEGCEARFVLVGNADEESRGAVPAETLRSWDEMDGIEWWGFCEDMPAVLAQSHVVCLPTTYGEGVPKILIEAGATGRPLVATDTPGCRNIVRDGENGILVPPEDEEALAEALRFLIDNADVRRTMGAESRRIVEEDFSDETVIQGTIEVYEEACGRSV